MNLAFFTFNAVLFAGLAVWQWHLGRKQKSLEAFRRLLWNERNQIVDEWDRIVRAAQMVEQSMGGEQEDPGDCDDKQKADIATLERWYSL
jgi:hypothetical protein